MSDNSWYKKGELPPVGVVCEWSHNGIVWEPCEIIHYYMNTVLTDHAFHRGNVRLSKLDGMKFRTTKTERELAIEAALKVFNVGPEVDKLLFTMAGALFDAGLLRSKNES